MITQLSLPLEISEETVVLIPWQRNCPELAVYLRETLEGIWAAMNYCPKDTRLSGLFDSVRGPYGSRQSAIRNAVAHGCAHIDAHHTRTPECARLYQAAGMRHPSTRQT